MLVDQEKCTGCGLCLPYCPAQAITLVHVLGPVAETNARQSMRAVIDQEACLECGNCLRTNVVRCPGKAFYEQPGIYETPRAIRRFFSDPMTTHKVTKIPGRGTEEVKTNDVTARVCRGEVGIAIEVGRPCAGTDMLNVEKLTTALAALGIAFEEGNPLTHLMDDASKGTIAPMYREERLVSAIIEFSIPIENLSEVLTTVTQVAQTLDTIFSLDMVGCYEEDGSLPLLEVLKTQGLKPRINSKVNLGMGRPLKRTREKKEV